MRALRRATTSILAPEQQACVCATQRASPLWNEHFILSTLKSESTSRSTIRHSRQKRLYSTEAPQQVILTSMQRILELKMAQKRVPVTNSVVGVNPVSTVATESYNSLYERAILAEIESANRVGDTAKSSELIKTLYHPRTNFPSTPAVWLEQLKIYRIMLQGQAALDALTLHIPHCGFPPTQEMYGVVFRALGVSGLGSKILSLLADMKRRRLSPTSVTLEDALFGLAASGLRKEAMTLLSEIPTKYSIKQTGRHFHIAIEMYCKADDVRRARKLLSDMCNLGIKPIERSVCLVSILQIKKSSPSKEDILHGVAEYENLLEKCGISMADARKTSEVFYSYVLSLVATRQDLANELADTIFLRAQSRKVRFTALLLNASMEAYIWAGEYGKALGLFRRMVLGVTFQGPLKYTSPYTTDSSTMASVSSENHENARRRIAPDERTLRLLLRICQKRQEWEVAYKYWNLFQHDFGIHASSKSLGVMVAILSAAGKRDEAMKLLLDSKSSILVEADGDVLGGLLEGCIEARRLDLAAEIAQLAENSEIPMTRTLGSRLTRYYWATQDLPRAADLWAKLRATKCLSPTAAGYMVEMVTRQFGLEKAEIFYEDYLESKNNVTHFLTYMMLRCYLMFGTFEQAIQHLSMVQSKHGLLPSVLHSSLLLRMAARAGDVDKVSQVFELCVSRPEWRFTKPFCIRVLLAFLAQGIGGIDRREKEVAEGWLDVALKPTRIRGGKYILALERGDRDVFVNMVRGWISQARRRRGQTVSSSTSSVEPANDQTSSNTSQMS